MVYHLPSIIYPGPLSSHFLPLTAFGFPFGPKDSKKVSILYLCSEGIAVSDCHFPALGFLADCVVAEIDVQYRQTRFAFGASFISLASLI